MRRIAKNKQRYVGIDPSVTGLGLTIFDNKGNMIEEHEFSDSGKDDPMRFMRLADKVMARLNPSDKVFIEGFSMGSKGAGVSKMFGIGWCIRIYLENEQIAWHDIPPTSLKKFATGKGQVKKENMILPIYKKWEYESASDNLRDSFVLGKMCYSAFEGVKLLAYEKEVLKKLKLI